MTDLERYNDWLNIKAGEWEAKCIRCGACCGSLDDPCENLHKNSEGKLYCSFYQQRFGKWHTLSGKEFTCVSIREKIAQGHSWLGDEHCGYKHERGYTLLNLQ
jgi:uncharacterized cysteine cluster protein YcgN (CxxCxxCC family)